MDSVSDSGKSIPLSIASASIPSTTSIAHAMPFPRISTLDSEGLSLVQAANGSEDVENALKSTEPELVRKLAAILANSTRHASEGSISSILTELPLYQALIRENPNIFKPIDAEAQQSSVPMESEKSESKSESVKLKLTMKPKPAEEPKPEPATEPAPPEVLPEVSVVVEDFQVKMQADEDDPVTIGVRKSACLLNDTIEMYLDSFDRVGSVSTPSTAAPQIQSREEYLKTISAEVAKLVDMTKLNLADGDALGRLVVALDSIIVAGKTSFWLESDKGKDKDKDEDVDMELKTKVKGKGKGKKIQIDASDIVDFSAQSLVFSGIDAALTAMRIMGSDGIPRTVFVEEVMEDCVQLLRFQLEQMVYPVFANKSADDDGIVKDQSRSRIVTTETIQAQKKCILPLLGQLSTLFDLLQTVVSREMIQDSLLVTMSNVALSTFFSEAPNNLQLCAIDLVQVIFYKFTKHRQIIMDEITGSLAKLPTNKRHLRVHKIHGVDATIQNVTALVLHLIQSCAGLPAPKPSETTDIAKKVIDKDKEEEDEDEEGEKEAIDMDVAIGSESESDVDYSLSAASKAANMFLLPLITRCFSRGVSGETADYRSLLENFVVDLIVVTTVPEWPAAEMVLHQISLTMIRLISDKSTETQGRFFAMDILGMIAARVRHDLMLFNTESKRIMSYREKEKEKQAKETEHENDHDQVLCYCQNIVDPAADESVQCNQCMRYCHAECIGSVSDGEWCCDLCSAKVHIISQVSMLNFKAVQDAKAEEEAEVAKKPAPKRGKAKGRGGRGRGKGRGKKAESDADDEGEKQIQSGEWAGTTVQMIDVESLLQEDPRFLFRQMILDYMAARTRADPLVKFARRFSLCQWYDDFEKDGECEFEITKKFFRMEWNNSLLSTSNIPGLLWMSSSSFKQDRLEHAVRILDSERSLMADFDTLQVHILGSLSDSSGMLRARALKALASIVEADPSVLGEKQVQLAVMHRFLDSSIMVRDAAVDLVGRFLFSKPELIDQYYDVIVARLLDTGVSVRKRVVKILRLICQRIPNHAKCGDILVRLVGRMKDEDGVREIVTSAFEDIWFSPLIADKGKDEGQAVEGSSSRSKLRSRSRSKSFIQHLQRACSKTESETKASDNFVQILMASAAPSSQSQLEKDKDVSMDDGDKVDIQENAYSELHRRTMQIVHVVSNTHQQQGDWLEKLLENLLERENEAVRSSGSGDLLVEDQWNDVLSAEDISKHSNMKLLHTFPIRTLCSALIADLIELILSLEEDQELSSVSMLHCLHSLNVFAAALPQQVAAHIHTLVPYLTPQTDPSGVQNPEEQSRLSAISTILWRILPLLKHPTVSLLSNMEKQLTALIYTQGVSVVQSAVKCLCVLVDLHTHNTILLREMISKFHKFLVGKMNEFKGYERQLPTGVARFPSLTRSLFTAGLLYRHFDFDSIVLDEYDKDRDWDVEGDLVPGQMGTTLFKVYVHYCSSVCRMLGLAVNMNVKTSGAGGADIDVSTQVPPSSPLHNGVTEVLLRGLQGLGHLIVRMPALAVDRSCSAMLTAALSSKAPTTIKVQGLRVFADFLADEEERLLLLERVNTPASALLGSPGPPITALSSLPPTATARAMTPFRDRERDKDVPKTPNTASEEYRPQTPMGQKVDSGVTSGLIQYHLKSILALAEDHHDLVRITAVNVVGLVLRHGLILPVLCIPSLIAKELDPSQQIRDAAHRVLGFVVDRYASFSKNPTHLLEGMSLAHSFLEGRDAGAKERYDYDSSCVSGLGRFYSLGFRSDRAARSQVLNAIVKAFEGSSSSSSSASSPSLSLSYLCFLAHVITSLPYSNQDEPLLIIHSINRTLSYKGGMVLSQMRDACASMREGAVYDSDEESFAPIQSKGGDGGDGDGDIEMPADADADADINVDLLRLQSKAMALLMSVKTYLKEAYQLSDRACALFSPVNPSTIPKPVNRHPDIGEFTCSGVLSEFSSTAAASTSRKGKKRRKGVIEGEGEDSVGIRHEYEVFKRLMSTESGGDIGEHAAVAWSADRRGRMKAKVSSGGGGGELTFVDQDRKRKREKADKKRKMKTKERADKAAKRERVKSKLKQLEDGEVSDVSEEDWDVSDSDWNE